MWGVGRGTKLFIATFTDNEKSRITIMLGVTAAGRKLPTYPADHFQRHGLSLAMSKQTKKKKNEARKITIHSIMIHSVTFV